MLGKYRLIAELAQGGMGTVYLAVALGPAGFHKLVVIKQLRPAFAGNASFREMFLQEARLAAYLHHPNIVQTYEIVCDAEQGHYIVMEYLEGVSLKRAVRKLRARGSPKARAVYERVILDALAALEYAHDLKDFDGQPLDLVHRDVNPDNILVVYGGYTKLFDFGIAKAANSNQETQAGILKGKLRYMAPEQMTGDAIDRRTDLFAVGGMLWDALVGRALWEGSRSIDVMSALVQGTIPRPRSVNPAVSPELDEICMRALAIEPPDRFPTAAAFRADLEKAVGPEIMSVEELGALLTSSFDQDRQRMRDLVAEQLRPGHDAPIRVIHSAPAELSHASVSALASSIPPVATSGGVVVAPAPAEISPEIALDVPLQPDAELDVPFRRGRSKTLVWGVIGGVATAAVVAALAASSAGPHPIASATAPGPTATAAAVERESPAISPPTSPPSPTLASPLASPDSDEKRERLALPARQKWPRAGGGFAPRNPTTTPPSAASGAAPSVLAASPPTSPSPAAVESEIAAPAVPVSVNPQPTAALPTSTVITSPGALQEAPRPMAPSAPAAAAPDLPRGTIAASAIVAVVRAHATEIQRCVETTPDQLYLNACESLGKTPAVCRRARVNLAAVVGPDGRVTQVSTSASRDGTARLEECIRNAVQGWTFPAPAGGVGGRISYPFIFE
jgi:eukaryotic-like serine/threonine-protein kinase